MTVLSRDQILAAEDAVFDEVSVPEWSGKVRVRGLTGNERDAFEASVMQQRGDKLIPKLRGARAKLVSLAVVGEDGARLFSEKDVARLGEKSAVALERVFAKAQELSGLTDQDVEDLAGNSDADPLGDSSSDSPDISD